MNSQIWLRQKLSVRLDLSPGTTGSRRHGEQFELQAFEETHQACHRFLSHIPAVKDQSASDAEDPDREFDLAEDQRPDQLPPVGLRLHSQPHESLAGQMKVALQAAEVAAE